MKLVRWTKASGEGRTMWHIDTETLSDTRGRTGCGKRYPRERAEIVEGDWREPMCGGCVTAHQSAPPIAES